MVLEREKGRGKKGGRREGGKEGKREEEREERDLNMNAFKEAISCSESLLWTLALNFCCHIIPLVLWDFYLPTLIPNAEPFKNHSFIASEANKV